MTKPSLVNRSNEYDLKILKVEYLRNRLSDHTQFSNLDLGDQIKVFKYLKWRCSSMEDNLKILKVEYLSNHLLDPTQICNLSLDDQTILYTFFEWRQPPMEDDLLKVECLSNHLSHHPAPDNTVCFTY